MAKNQNQTPLVSSVSTKLRETIRTQDTQVVTPEEIKEKKRDMLGVIDKSLQLFIKNLNDGKVEMNNSVDLERLVKLSLLLSGEADTVTGKPYGEQERETTISNATISMSKIDEILDLNDTEVKKMYDKISLGYNEINDLDD